MLLNELDDFLFRCGEFFLIRKLLDNHEKTLLYAINLFFIVY